MSLLTARPLDRGQMDSPGRQLNHKKASQNKSGSRYNKYATRSLTLCHSAQSQADAPFQHWLHMLHAVPARARLSCRACLTSLTHSMNRRVSPSPRSAAAHLNEMPLLDPAVWANKPQKLPLAPYRSTTFTVNQTHLAIARHSWCGTLTYKRGGSILHWRLSDGSGCGVATLPNRFLAPFAFEQLEV